LLMLEEYNGGQDPGVLGGVPKRHPSTRFTAPLTGAHKSLALDFDPNRIVGFGRRRRPSPTRPQACDTSRRLRRVGEAMRHPAVIGRSLGAACFYEGRCLL
jgi:hypothetical protein